MDDPDFPASASASAPALDTLAGVADTLAAAFDSGDPDATTQALARVADAPALAHLAAAAGLPRADLAAAMRGGAMPLDMLLAIMKVIDLHMGGGARPS